jgi:KDO2-lipid IV(A) lauroyltransferase
MQRVIGSLYWIFLRGLSYLPFSALYLVSSILCEFIFSGLKYRRKVVRENLKQSFPEKTDHELFIIERKFYQSLVDIFFECIKTYSLSDRKIRLRFQIENPELIEELFKEGRSIFLLGSHQFNWEWANHALSIASKYPLLGVFLPINNRYVDDLFLKIRSLRGQILIPASEFKKEFPKYSPQPTLSVLMGDQNPGDPNKAFWIPFLGREAPFHGGLERVARRQPVAVVYGEIIKIKRGFYRGKIHLVCKDSTQIQPGEITHRYVTLLDESIRRQPENWVWSHRRWRHQRPVAQQKSVPIESSQYANSIPELV